jgi:hypothetical protein
MNPAQKALGLTVIAAISACSSPAPNTNNATKSAVKKGPLPSEPSAARAAILAAVQKSERPVVVVSLDGETIFDHSHHVQRIVMEALSETGRDEAMRRLAERFATGDRSLRTLEGMSKIANVDDPNFNALLERRYDERFASDAYLPESMPRPGAQGFLKSLHNAGATLVYTTRLGLVRSGSGLVQSLRNAGLPVLDPRGLLFSRMNRDEAQPKTVAERVALITKLGDVVATFAAEEDDLTHLKKSYPNAWGVRLAPIGKLAPGAWNVWATNDELHNYFKAQGKMPSGAPLPPPAGVPGYGVPDLPPPAAPTDAPPPVEQGAPPPSP